MSLVHGSKMRNKIMKRIGLLGFDEVAGLDLVGPLEAFASATLQPDGDSSAPVIHHCYETMVIGETGRPFLTESGIVMTPHTSLDSVQAAGLDTLIICGGRGLRRPAVNAHVAAWVQAHASSIRRIATVCTGIYALAATGLLDGRHVTTHWRFAGDVARRFPRLNVEPNAIFLKDGPFYTSAGCTAGIDLALALIEEDHGRRAALTVARELVVYLKREGGQEQYSEPLQFQSGSQDRLSELVPWIAANLRADLSVESMAGRACLCSRHFSRRFQQVFGATPADFVKRMRLDEARRRLSQRGSSIAQVAGSVGFNSADSFRRAFERRFGTSPSSYRERFQVQVPSRPAEAPGLLADPEEFVAGSRSPNSSCLVLRQA
jgi:transcriptional regulator GlxA family with amidase domain